jgi:hypothetical protein
MSIFQDYRFWVLISVLGFGLFFLSSDFREDEEGGVVFPYFVLVVFSFPIAFLIWLLVH